MYSRRGPQRFEHALQNADEFRNGVRFQFGVGHFHGIKGYREVGVGRVKVNNIFGALGRNALQDIKRVVAVRVDHRKAVRAVNVG